MRRYLRIFVNLDRRENASVDYMGECPHFLETDIDIAHDSVTDFEMTQER